MNKIAFDIRELFDRPAGVGRFVRSLLGAMEKVDQTQKFCWISDHRKIAISNDQSELINISLPKLWWHLSCANIIKKTQDIYPFIATRSSIVPSLVGNKSFIIIYDLVFTKYGHYLTLKTRLLERLFTRRAMAASKRIITISQTTASDIVKYYPEAQRKISVIPMAVDAIFVRRKAHTDVLQRLGIDGKYILTVGTIEPRKNHVNLINAYYGLSENIRKSYKLVIVGKKGWMYDKVIQMIKMDNNRQIIFLEYISDNDLVDVYNGASLFIYLSLYEGYGLPIIEAMRCAVPVIASNVSSMPEAAGGAAALVSPFNVKEISETIEHVATNDRLKANMGQKSEMYARNLTWDKTASVMYEIIKSNPMGCS